jgi:hypothetical protein
MCSRALLRSTVLLGTLVFASCPALAADDAPAQGRDRSKSAPDAEPKYDPDNVTAISRYMEAVVKGSGKFLAHDFKGALETYRGAVALAPRNPLGPYLIAETQIAMGNLAEAEATLKEAEPLTDERTAGLRAKILFLTADLMERNKKWEEAKVAWQAYSEWAGTHAKVSFPGSATSRTQAIDQMLKQEKAMEVVRQRTAAEKAAPSTPPTPPKK